MEEKKSTPKVSASEEPQKNQQKRIADKHERNKQWAISKMKRRIPFEIWKSLKDWTDEEIELYKKLDDTISRVASGELTL